MKKFIVYGTAVLTLSAAPLMAQVGSGTSGQGGITPGVSGATQPPTSGGATDQGGSRPGSTTEPDSRPAQPNAPTGSGAPAGQADDPGNNTRREESGSATAVADESFVVEAAQGGMAEVELGRLAAQKGTDPRVKQFGQRMVADHTKANTELQALAGRKKIAIPADVTAKHKETHDELSRLSGAAFDQAYVREMVANHTKDIVEFRKEADHGKDDDVKAFASKTLPTLEEHMKMVQDLNRDLGQSAVGTSGSQPSPR